MLAILIGKLILFLTRALKLGGGSAAPGLYALKIEPKLVEKLSTKIPRNIVITGTNGKTTTSRMLAHFAKAHGLSVIRNHTGSNLERGIASALIQHTPLGWNLFNTGGYLGSNLGIWELDEAAFNSVSPKLKPDVAVFLNVFRDQLDRYGEVDSVIKKWSKTLTTLPSQTIILVNGDDANTAKLASYFKGKVYKFGVKDYKIVGESILHKKERENLNCEAKNVKLKGLKGSSFACIINHKSFIINLPLPGVYHIYDFLAAFYAGYELGFDTKKMIRSLKSFTPAFGRMEKFSLQPRRLHRKQDGFIFLIKNPAGATQVFQTIAPQIKKSDRLLLALNDNLADGTDVSWIWDGQFEILANQSINGRIGFDTIVSGTRAHDLAVRLKYAGFNPEQIIVEPSLEKAFRASKKGLKGRLFILPTYTAMLELQRILVKIGIKGEYWNE